jgi:hypothetical protein
VYRWTNGDGEVHYSNDPGDAPAGAQTERLPDYPSDAPPTGLVVEGTSARSAQEANEVGGSQGDVQSQAQAEVDTERMELEHEYRRKRAQLVDIERQIDGLTKAQGDAPRIGEEAVRAFDERNQKAVELQVERHKLVKEMDGVRARYADLERRALEAYGGQLPSWWKALPDSP